MVGIVHLVLQRWRTDPQRCRIDLYHVLFPLLCVSFLQVWQGFWDSWIAASGVHPKSGL